MLAANELCIRLSSELLPLMISSGFHVITMDVHNEDDGLSCIFFCHCCLFILSYFRFYMVPALVSLILVEE